MYTSHLHSLLHLPLANHVSMAGVNLFCHHFAGLNNLDPVTYDETTKNRF